MMSLTPISCYLCKKPASETCSGCSRLYYCSKECKDKHWTVQHHKYCQIMSKDIANYAHLQQRQAQLDNTSLALTIIHGLLAKDQKHDGVIIVWFTVPMEQPKQEIHISYVAKSKISPKYDFDSPKVTYFVQQNPIDSSKSDIFCVELDINSLINNRRPCPRQLSDMLKQVLDHKIVVVVDEVSQNDFVTNTKLRIACYDLGNNNPLAGPK